MVYVGWGLCICKTGERIHLVYTSFEVLSSLMEISYKDYNLIKIYMRIQIKFVYVKSCDKRIKCSGIYMSLN